MRGSRHFPLSSLLCPLCFSLCVSLPSCFFMEMYLCSSLNLTRFPPSPTHTSRAWWRGERRGAASAQTCHPAPCWNCSTVCSEFSCFLFFPLFRCCFSADELHCDFFFLLVQQVFLGRKADVVGGAATRRQRPLSDEEARPTISEVLSQRSHVIHGDFKRAKKKKLKGRNTGGILLSRRLMRPL